MVRDIDHGLGIRATLAAVDDRALVGEAFRDIENIEAADLPEPHSAVTFRPRVVVTADTNTVFETSVGVIHRINDRTRFVAHAECGQPQVVDEDVATLVTENRHATVDLVREFSHDSPPSDTDRSSWRAHLLAVRLLSAIIFEFL